jgi:hypothetical protein
MDRDPHPLIESGPDRPSFPQVEVYTRAANPEPVPHLPRYRALRRCIFLIVLLGVQLPGVAWDFLRQAQ